MNRSITLWILLLVVLALILTWRRRVGVWRTRGTSDGNGRFLPAATPAASFTARLVEATVLGASAAIVLAMSATWPSTGGLMLMLDELQPPYAIAHIVMFVCAVTGAAIAILITLLGRTASGTVIVAFVLISYGLVLNGGDYPGPPFFPKDMTAPRIAYTIDIADTNAEGAELWVNGVYLGKTPYRTTLADFKAQVPYWPDPPEDFETKKVEVPRYEPRSTYTSIKRTWIKFQLPRGPSWDSGGRRRRRDREEKAYYARVRYAGEWGVTTGGSGSGGGGGRLTYQATSHFGVTFPQREKRLQALLDKARLSDYQVGPTWFQAMETYDEDGWMALRGATNAEPEMMDLLDAWATWRYELVEVDDAESAWNTFERICQEAVERRQYLTPSVAGRAVELLVPQLPPHRLFERATKLLKRTGSFGYFKWQMNDRLQFGYSQRPGVVHFAGGTVFSAYSGGPIGMPKLPMDGYPVAHAVWMLYEHDPVPVQQRIVPEIVRWQYEAGLVDLLVAAAYFGGPAIDQFLLRQNWRAAPEDLEWEERLHQGGVDANKWLYLLASLNDSVGREFRREHPHAVMNLADKFYEHGFASWNARIDFVFLDSWLAKEYWPRFARLARRQSPDFALETQWRYLLKMGNLATPSMYVDAWEETNIELGDFHNALDLLDALDPDKQVEVVARLIRQVRERPENISRVLQGFDSPERVISQLQAYSEGSAKDRRARLLFSDLQEATGDETNRLRGNVPLWLAHAQPESPLVEMLATSDAPELRLMVRDALREHPTPHHRELLDRLLQDPVPAVRAAAKEVAADLAQLAAESPLRYSSQTPSE